MNQLRLIITLKNNYYFKEKLNYNIIMKKEDVKKYVEEEIESMDYPSDFFDLDSMDRMELILRCEAEFFVSIDDAEVQHNWNTDEFVDYVCNKIIKKLL